MVKYSDDTIYCVSNSVADFIQSTLLSKGGVQKAIRTWYSGLVIGIGFPDLTSLVPPHLAIVMIDNPAPTEDYLDDVVSESIWFDARIFAGGDESDIENKVQRDKLIGDVKSILIGSIVPVYAWNGGTKGSELGECAIKNVSATQLPEIGVTVAEKYQGRVRFTADFLSDI